MCIRDSRLTDAEKAFVLPAKLMALIAYRLLTNQAEEAREILENFTPALTLEKYLEYIG